MSISSSEALSLFFLESREELVGFLQRRLRCPETAADLAQETYLRLHASGQRASIVNLRALAFRIAANLAVDHVRKRRTRARFESDTDGEIDPVELAPCPRPGPEHVFTARQDLAHIRAALNELPEGKRMALYLNVAEGLTHAQIGERLGISERMVAKRIADALKHCRDSRKEE